MIAIFGIQFWMQYIIDSLGSKLPIQLGIARLLFQWYNKIYITNAYWYFVFFSYMSFFNHKEIAYEK